MKLTLKEWQVVNKPIDNLIVQASIRDGSDSWRPWPIGMCWQYTICKGDIQIGTHENLVLSAFNISTDSMRRPHIINRRTIAETLLKNGIPNSTLEHEAYFSVLPTYKFIISPEGNGIDCHRHYEALLAGSIPIMERNPLTEIKYKGCPVVWTTDYSEITPGYLLNIYETMLNTTYDFSSLFLSYYTIDQQQQIKIDGNYWVQRTTKQIWYKPAKLNIVYAFVGQLPKYAIESVFQTRLFYDGPIYFIISDTESEFATILKQYNVTLINYTEVLDSDFVNLVKKQQNRFCIVPELKGREKLFIYSFERFYLLHNLMQKYQLENIFFMELDNLVYEDPRIWLSQFSQKSMAYMFDNYDRASTGIAYIKNTAILKRFLQHSNNYILTDEGFINEMTALYRFWESNKSDVQLLPTLFPSESYPTQVYETFPNYNSVFDALSMGIYMGGADTTQTNTKPIKGQKSTWGLVDYTKFMYKWSRDELKRKAPYIFDGDQWLKINNLHIHSKDLTPFLSQGLNN